MYNCQPQFYYASVYLRNGQKRGQNMSNLYKSLSDLCADRGITGYRMCKDIGIQPSIMTDLKMNRRNGVNAETANKIANYFNVSVGRLLGSEPQKETATIDLVDDDLKEYLEELRARPEMRMLFSTTKTATKAQIEAIVKMVEEMQG